MYPRDSEFSRGMKKAFSNVASPKREIFLNKADWIPQFLAVRAGCQRRSGFFGMPLPANRLVLNELPIICSVSSY
jgi:hypothetical protein